MEVVGVDGPDDDAAEALGEDVAGLDLETFFIVVAEPLVSSVAVRTDNLLILGRKNRNSSVSSWARHFHFCYIVEEKNPHCA